MGTIVNGPGEFRRGGPPPASCEAVDREAVRYFFNGLPKARGRAVAAHFAGCPRCRRKLAVLAVVWALAGAAGR